MASRKLIVEIIGDSKSLERAFDRSGRKGKSFGKDMSQAGRGVVAVSGLFSGLGRQVAFASSAFLGGAGLTKLLRDSVSEAQEAAKTQRQLGAQFRANGQDLSQYQQQIDATSTRLSHLAGIQDEEFTQAFTDSFRGTKDVTSALKVEAVAADVARGRGVQLSAAAIALTKAYLGQSTALKRLGIQIPANVKGMEALELVGRRFAGQAAAGTTNQQRLSVALAETEETIGRALLPIVEKYTRKLDEWLSKEENQQRVQRGAEKSAKILGGAITVGAKAVELATSRWNPFVDVVQLSAAAIHGLNKEQREFNKLIEISKRGLPTGEDVAQRGAAARQQTIAGTGGSGAATRRRRASLSFQISLAEENLAKAQLTASDRDDRAVLVRLAALTRQKITKTKELGERTRLLRSLGTIQAQIDRIDEDANQKRVSAAEKAAAKAKAAREKLAAIAKKAADKERAQRTKDREAVARRAKEARDAAKAAAQDFRDLLQTERGRIGDLFGGPFFNPSEAQRKAALGAPTPGSNVKSLIADLKAQIQQFKAFQRDLQTLAKRGAPPQLLAELRQAGLDVAPQVHALATSGAGSFAQFKQLFIQRERLAVQAAKAARPIINLTVIVDKDTGHVSVKTTPHGQKRGRNPGVIINQGRVIN